MDKWEFYKDSKREWRWYRIAPNCEVVEFSSEMVTRTSKIALQTLVGMDTPAINYYQQITRRFI